MSVSNILTKNEYELFCGSLNGINPPTGFTGPIGPTGATGASPNGFTGPRGATGATGSSGNLNSLGGLTASAQIFDTQTNGFSVTSSVSSHTLNIDNSVSFDVIITSNVTETKTVTCKYSILGKLRQITFPTTVLTTKTGDPSPIYITGLPAFICPLTDFTAVIRTVDYLELHFALCTLDTANFQLVITRYPDVNFPYTSGTIYISGFSLNYFYTS